MLVLSLGFMAGGPPVGPGQELQTLRISWRGRRPGCERRRRPDIAACPSPGEPSPPLATDRSATVGRHCHANLFPSGVSFLMPAAIMDLDHRMAIVHDLQRTVLDRASLDVVILDLVHGERRVHNLLAGRANSGREPGDDVPAGHTSQSHPAEESGDLALEAPDQPHCRADARRDRRLMPFQVEVTPGFQSVSHAVNIANRVQRAGDASPFAASMPAVMVQSTGPAEGITHIPASAKRHSGIHPHTTHPPITVSWITSLPATKCGDLPS